MTDKREQLFMAIGNIDDDLILEADEKAPPESHTPKLTLYKRAAALAASFALCILLWSAVKPLLAGKGAMDNMEEGSAEGMLEAAPQETRPSAGGGETPPPNVILGSQLPLDECRGNGRRSYEGLLLPMMTQSGGDSLRVERSLTLDMQTLNESVTPPVPEPVISDRYILHNTGKEPVTTDLLYPIFSTLSYAGDSLPQLTLNGEPLEAALEVGAFIGQMQDSQELEQLLTHSAEGLNENTPVMVYELTSEDSAEDLPSGVTVAVELSYSEEVPIFTSGMNGLSIDGDKRIYSLFAREFDRAPEISHCIIALTDREAQYSVSAYTEGSLETPLEGLTAHVTAYPSTLGKVIQKSAEQELERLGDGLPPEVTEELAVRAAMSQLETLLLQDDTLDLMMFAKSDLWDGRYLFRLRTPVTIPAGGTVEVTARWQYDSRVSLPMESESLDGGRISFRLIPSADSSLTADSLTAELILPDNVTLLEGPLDPSGEKTALDPQTEEYRIQMEYYE